MYPDSKVPSLKTYVTVTILQGLYTRIHDYYIKIIKRCILGINYPISLRIKFDVW